jgi:hypothetical protein
MKKDSLNAGFKRRQVLSYGAAGFAALAGSKNLAFAATAPTHSAQVKLNGTQYLFRQDDGTSLGDFVSTIGGFTQSCIITRVQGCPLTVYFRPDKTSARNEVVFELGSVFNGTAADLGPYTVVISLGSQVLATVDVPAHYWFSRWRWQSAVRPICADIDKMIAQNLLPPFDRAGQLSIAATSPSSISTAAGTGSSTVCLPTGALPVAPIIAQTQPQSTYVPYAVMGLAGITAYMPQTGERPDIGIVTEPQAEYICTSRQAALDVMRARAEGAGTCPWHMRDEHTNAPLNLRTYPQATWYTDTTQGTPYVKTTKTPVTLDSSHTPALAYVPYLLTGDPYHLEDLQFQANWNIGSLTPQYRMTFPQSRGFAWNLRTLAQSARITPDRVPSWLLPNQYFVDFLTDYRQYFETNYVNSSQPERARFRVTTNIDNSRDEGPTAPAGTWTAPWEEDFIATVMGWVVAMGFTEWQAAYQWKFSSTFARTSGTSGWVRAQSTPYRMILRATATAPVANSWADVWNLTKQITQITYTDANTWAPTDMTYLTYTRGALVYVDQLKEWNVAENLAWATAQLRAKNWNTAYKWRLGKGLS